MAESQSVYGLPTRPDVEAFAESLTDAQLHCRSWGHQPKQRVVRRVRVEGSSAEYFEVVLVCNNNCGTQWVKLLNTENGMQVYHKTMYDASYLARGLGGRVIGPARAIVRLEAAERAYRPEAA